MTQSLKRYIELADLSFAVFGCKECGGEISVRIDHNVHVPAQCPVCGKRWVDGLSKNRQADRVSEFFEAYRRLAQVVADDVSPVGFDLKLQLAPDESK